MRVAMVAFTRRGLDLARGLVRALAADGDTVTLSAPERLAVGGDVHALDSLADWTAQAWADSDALVFVSATGIAVRAVAPLVADKFTDPAVVCVDEAGAVAVPLLSGHVGGANVLARRVARACGGTAAVSTATDVNGLWAPDEWAARNGLAIVEREAARRVSAALLEGRPVGVVSDVPVAGASPAQLVTGDDAQGCELGICISWRTGRTPFATTLHLVPRCVVAGVGCKRGTSAARIEALVDRCLQEAGVAPEALATVASIDVKADEEGLRAFAKARGCELAFYSAEELASVPGEFASSEFVQRTVGVGNVCERAACADGRTLLLGRRSADGVTVALGLADPQLAWPDAAVRKGAGQAGADGRPDATTPHEEQACGPTSVAGSSFIIADTDMCCAADPAPATVVCVGLGPGAGDDMTLRARKALDAADLIVGYTSYIDLIRADYPDKELLATSMRREVERCRLALEHAVAGRRVAMVCSGDPGIYGMAGLLMELAQEYGDVDVQVVPGVSAANGGAALLGAPLMHDWCCISLSDLMTPWELIERRLVAAAQADLCICLYNPASRHRPDHLRRACDVLLAHRDAATVCGYARAIGRAGQSWRVCSLGELREAAVDMLTCVYVGNSQTREVGGRMLTPRGYDLGRDAGQPGSPESAADRRTEPELTDAPEREVLVFGGTTEGRQLVEWLAARGNARVVACTATEYGASLLPAGPRVQAVEGPLSPGAKCKLMEAHRFACIVDATHPYATHISESVAELGKSYGVDVLRLVREDVCEPGEPGEQPVPAPAPWTSVADAEEAARWLASTEGRILLTTGTKDLGAFVRLVPDAAERLYVRLLPVAASLDKARELGIPVSHLIGMQGPFSEGLNRAMIGELGIAHLVTKRSGAAGGFDDKLRAAQACGIDLVVIEPPRQEEGLDLAATQRLLEVRYGL